MKKQTNIFEDVLRKADPIALAATADLVPVMTSGGNRNGLSGTGDRRPMVYRDGALDARECPSRMGNRLHYPDGRVEVIV